MLTGEREKNKKELTKFCNKLRCPLCDGQLDGNISDIGANLYCVNSNDEYKCQYIKGNDIPVYEKLTFIYPQYRYEILLQQEGPYTFRSIVDRLNLDYSPQHINSSRKRLFDYVGERLLFFRCRMEEDVFLKKLKLYNLFS